MSLPTDPGTAPSVIKDSTRQRLGLLTPEELAVTLKVTESTLQTWRSEGAGPLCIKLGKQVFYRMNDIQDWIAEQQATRGSKDDAQEPSQSEQAQVA